MAMATTLRPHTIDDRPIRRITFDDVLGMLHAGLLHEDDPVELVDGILVEMSPEGFDHYSTVTAINRILVAAYPEPFGIAPQSTYRRDQWQFRQPDFVVARALPDRWPQGDEVTLILEVSNSTLRYDLRRKAADYASWGIPEYWVLDLTGRRVVVHRGPRDGGYESVTEVHDGDTVTLPDVGVAVTVAKLLGRLPPPTS